MLQPVRISPRQMMLLIVCIKLSALTTYAPIITSTGQGVRDSWLAAVMAGTAALGLTLLALRLGARYPRKSIFLYCEDALGKWAGKLIGLILLLFLIYYTALCLRMFTQFIQATMLPSTPLTVLTLVAMCITVYLAASGLEVLGRFTELVGPILLLLLPLLLVLVEPQMNLHKLLPVLENGIKPVVVHALSPVGIFGEAVWVVLLALPHLNKPRDAGKYVVYAFLINIFAVGGVSAGIIAIFGPMMAGHLFFPTLSMVSVISIGNFLERLEAFMSVLFILTMFIKTGLFFYGVAAGFGQWLNLRDYRPLVLPLAVVVASLSMFIVENIVDIKEFCSPGYFFPFTMSMELGIPLVLLTGTLVQNHLKGRT